MKMEQTTNCITLENNSANCYVNVIVNTLLNISHVKKLLDSDIDHPILNGLRQFMKNENYPKNADFFRQLVGNHKKDFEISGQQQDASLFLAAVLEFCLPLQKLFQNSVTIRDKCRNCDLVTYSFGGNQTCSLDLDNLDSNDFDFLIAVNSNQETTVVKRCLSEQCKTLKCNNEKNAGVPHNRDESFEFGSKVLVIKAKIFEHSGRLSDFRANKIVKTLKPEITSKLGPSTYKLRAIITHVNDSNIQEGHYIVDILHDKTWTRCNDLAVNNIKSPSKQGYLFVYEKIEVEKIVIQKDRLQTQEIQNDEEPTETLKVEQKSL